jgi:hypothetical protein
MFIYVVQTLQKKWNEICIKQLADGKYIENDCFPRTLKFEMLYFAPYVFYNAKHFLHQLYSFIIFSCPLCSCPSTSYVPFLGISLSALNMSLGEAAVCSPRCNPSLHRLRSSKGPMTLDFLIFIALGGFVMEFITNLPMDGMNFNFEVFRDLNLLLAVNIYIYA